LKNDAPQEIRICRRPHRDRITKMQNAKSKRGEKTGPRPCLNSWILLACLVASGAGAEERGRDPFFPAERLATAPARTTVRDRWVRDPFENPFGGTKKAANAPAEKRPAAGGALTGIIYGPDGSDRLALVGGEVLRIGGTVGGKTITDIRRKVIVLKDHSGGREELVLEDFTAGK